MEHTAQHPDFVARRDVHLCGEVPLDDAAGQARKLDDRPRDPARQQKAGDQRESRAGQRMQVKTELDAQGAAEGTNRIDDVPRAIVSC
jgi:hypothetical protein